jgi:two-component system response regulator YesN
MVNVSSSVFIIETDAGARTKENLFKVRDQVMYVSKLTRDRIHTDAMNYQSLRGKISDQNLTLSFIFPAIALIELENFSKIPQEKHTEMKQLSHFLKQNLTDGTVVFMDDMDHIGILFSWLSRGLAEKIRDMITNHFSFEVNIGVGKPYSNLEKVYPSYQQAVKALHQIFYKGKGQVIYFDEVREYCGSCEYSYIREKELYDKIKSANDSLEVKSAIELFYEFLLQNGLVESNEVFEITIRLLVGMEKRVFAEHGNESDYTKIEIMSVVQMRTLQEVKEYVYECLTELREVVSRKFKESKPSSIIKKTIQYMEKEFQHASLHSLAQKVYMTPSYLSLLFKMNTGKTFIEQMTEIRMDKAKHLLKNTHLKNYEVAETVGYHDSRYFSQIFKKKVGLSPSEYRESLNK